MNVKLRLGVWMLVLAGAATVLMRSSWPGTGDPAVAAVAVVRLVAGVLAIYLLAATVVALLVALRWQRAIGPAMVRRLVAAAVGGGLLVAPAVATADPRQASQLEAPVLRRVPEAAPQPSTPAPPDLRPAENEGEVTVVAGDHLWRIAATALRGRLGREPTDAEVVPYWQRLIVENRDRLVDRDNPDLIFADQVLRLPS